jgi:hypothetical protein
VSESDSDVDSRLRRAVMERAHMEAALLSALQTLRQREEELCELRETVKKSAETDADLVRILEFFEFDGEVLIDLFSLLLGISFGRI